MLITDQSLQSGIRDDHEAVARLITTVPAERLRQLLVVCGYFAAGACRHAADHDPALSFHGGLQQLALQLAATTP